MAITRRQADGKEKSFHLCAVCRSPATFAFLLLLFAFFLSACASTRPVIKIGLLAPFEGLYRQEGYAALGAMRAAIVEQNPAGVDVLPLALDTSRSVMRAGQKVLADPSVTVVIGPYWAADGVVLGSLADDKKWRTPYAPADNALWAEEAVTKAAAWSEQNGWHLQLAGDADGWSDSDRSVLSSPDDVQAGQSILWLGDAAAGADFALAVWTRLPDTPIGLYGSGAETFRRRTGEQVGGPVFLVGWIDDGYPDWIASQSPTPYTPAAYTVYRLTTDALRGLAGETIATGWQPAIFILDPKGIPVLSSDR